jgi:FKBP-type peptidyl-prolyl cis-trans isomerase
MIRPVPPVDAIVPGVVMQDMIVGRGILALPGDTVSVRYVRTRLDGTPFDPSGEWGAPIEFAVGMGRVTKGLEDGVKGMRVGGTRKLAIPADHAYVENGFTGIPAGATLVYDVELLRVQ